MPRYIFDDDKNESQFKIELHGFSDGSLQAYGAVIYSRCLSKSSNITSNLIASKSRVAPIKPTTIPRLELLGNLLLSRLMKKVKKALQNLGYTVKTCFWTDSKVTLSWIFADSEILEVFVQNRLKEIRSISKKQNWHFCSTKNNPADILTREERKISDFHKNQFWWKGPEYLSQEVIVYKNCTEEPCLQELARFSNPICNNKRKVGLDNVIEIEKFGCLQRLIRITGCVYRLYHNIKIKEKENHDVRPFFSAEEINNAQSSGLRLTNLSLQEKK